MADIAKVKRNVSKMIGQKAPESDIDAYVASEGITVDELQTKTPSMVGLGTGLGKGLFPNVQAATKSALGLKDFAERGTLLPLGRTKEGKLEAAIPEVAIGMVESAMLPGHVVKGGKATSQDMLAFAANMGLPATMRRVPGNAGMATSKRAFAQAAPATEKLMMESGKKFGKAEASGVVINDNKYIDFLSGLERQLSDEGIDPMLHPKATAVMKALEKRIGAPVDVGDLQIMRRQIGIAARSTIPELADERRLAMLMQDKLDDMVDNLSDADLARGDRAVLGSNLPEARKLWSMAKKSQTIEDTIERAKLSASGFDTGLKNEFLQLLKNKKKVRGFTSDEIIAMKEIAKGTTRTKVMRYLGRLSPYRGGGSNFLGSGLGSGAGAAVGSFFGGPAGAVVGSMAVPALGAVAYKGAERASLNAAEFARALAATGGVMPRVGPGPFGRMTQGVGPVAAGLFPERQEATEDLIRSGLFGPVY